MKQCSNCHAFLSSRRTSCPKCRADSLEEVESDTGAGAVPAAWIRVRTRTRTRTVPAPLAVDRVAGEVAPTVELDEAADDFVPTTEFRPDEHDRRWVAEPITRAARQSTAWMKKTANYGTAFPGTLSAPTPQVLSAVSRVDPPDLRVRSTPEKEPNPLEDLDLDFDEADFDLDYSLDFEPDHQAADNWSLAGLAPSTGVVDGPQSVAEDDEIVLLEEVVLVPMYDGDVGCVEDPPTIDLDLRNDLSRRVEKPARSAEDLRNDLLRRLDLAPQQTWREADPQPGERHAERMDALARALADSEPLWPSDDEPIEFAKPAASIADSVAPLTPQPKARAVAAQWVGRASAALLFFGVGVAISTGAPADHIAVLAAAALLCLAVALPRRARVWTVFAIGVITGVLAAWLHRLDALTGVLAPQNLEIWQSASVGATGLMVVWLLASVVEASVD